MIEIEREIYTHKKKKAMKPRGMGVDRAGVPSLRLGTLQCCGYGEMRGSSKRDRAVSDV